MDRSEPAPARAKPEIGQLGYQSVAVRGEEDVRGFHIPMHDPPPMGGRKPLAETRHQRHRLGNGKSSAFAKQLAVAISLGVVGQGVDDCLAD